MDALDPQLQMWSSASAEILLEFQACYSDSETYSLSAQGLWTLTEENETPPHIAKFCFQRSRFQEAGGADVHKHRRCSEWCDVSGGCGASGAHWLRGVQGTQVHCDLAAPSLVQENFYPCSSLGQTLRRQSKIGSVSRPSLSLSPLSTKQHLARHSGPG